MKKQGVFVRKSLTEWRSGKLVNTTEGTEKREHSRVSARWPVTVVTDRASIQAETRNITVNGVFISSKDLLRLHETFHFLISPPHREPIEVTGTIIHSDHHSLDEQNISYGMGICFVKVSDKDRHFLEDVVSAHPG